MNLRPTICHAIAVALTANVLAACGGFMAGIHDQPVKRAAGKDCVRYEFLYRQPHLGGEQWGDLELVGMAYPAGPGSYRYYGEYTTCPVAEPPPPALVEQWRSWRRVRVKNKDQYWQYNETIASEQVEPLALNAPAPPATRSVDGTLFRYTTYDAYFRGCEYWAAMKQKYKCVP